MTQLEKIVAENVIKLLGKPSRFDQVTSRLVGNNKYRVNVYQLLPGDEVCESVKLTDSFYVDADKKGKVLSPKIEKRY